MEHGNAQSVRVGVIGLGAMGGSVARHLSALEVATTVYDPDPAAVGRAVAAGCVAAGSAEAAAVLKDDFASSVVKVYRP